MKSYQEYETFNLYIGRLLNKQTLQIINHTKIKTISVQSDYTSGDIVYITDKKNQKIAEFSLREPYPILYSVGSHQFLFANQVYSYKYQTTGYYLDFHLNEIDTNHIILFTKQYHPDFYQVFEIKPVPSKEHYYFAKQII